MPKLQLTSQIYAVKLDPDLSPNDNTIAEVRMWRNKWVAQAIVSQHIIGEHDSPKSAASMLATKLRELGRARSKRVVAG